MSLKGKTLFITGASRGIGLAIALRAARDGANIAIAAKTDTPHPKLPGTIYTAAEEIAKAGGKALPLVGRRARRSAGEGRDRTHASRRSAASISWSTMPARCQRTPVVDTDMRRFDLMHQINTRGTFMVSKYAIPHLAKSEQPAHPDEFAAARHAGKVVCRLDRLFDRQVRHEPCRARPCRRTANAGHRRERAVAAHHHRDRRDQEPARRRSRDAHVAHAGDHGRRRLSDLPEAGAELHRQFPDRRHASSPAKA